ncbi:MAG: RNA polymerase sigma factor [Lewinellaceae bacterium]|nr:RNA polymerase sigma factor [Saprospiraceae bacterium]MCB9340341.1 RNA polymerase sigma factor [Lewinellaceae bacterium]
MTTIEFNSHYSNLESLLFAFAMKLTANREDARDLLQETIMRAYASKDRFAMGTNFKAWITTIMRNCFINEYRKRRTRNKVEQPLEENHEVAVKKAVRNSGPSIIMMKELRSMLNKIGDAHRVPFEMFFNGYEYQEIAEVLHLPMGTVKSRIFFARKKMKEMIDFSFGRDYFRRA